MHQSHTLQCRQVFPRRSNFVERPSNASLVDQSISITLQGRSAFICLDVPHFSFTLVTIPLVMVLYEYLVCISTLWPTMSTITFPRTLRPISDVSNNELQKQGMMTKDDTRHIPVILTTNLGRLFGPVGTFSILRSVSIPSMTRPKTTCFPSRKSHFAVVTKNLQAKRES